MDIYIEKGYLHNDRDIIIAKGPAYCTTAYGNKAEMSRHTTLEWAEIAKYPLDIQLAIPRTGEIENFLGIQSRTLTLVIWAHSDSIGVKSRS